MIKFEKINEVYSRIHCDSDVLYSLADDYSKYVDGYKFMPAFKSRRWDGKIRYINKSTRMFYSGLIPDIAKLCKEKYGESDFDLIGYDTHNKKYTEDEIINRISNFNLPHPLYDYQITGIVEALTKNRRILLSSTSSGKSLIIYCICRLLMEDNLKVLLTVSSIILANQMYSDFSDYSKDDDKFNIDDLVYISAEGRERVTKKPITISTWQAINELKKKKDDDTSKLENYLSNFDCVLSDEVHECDSVSMKNIMENSINAFIRLGFTGSLDQTTAQMEALIGLYGKPIVIKTARELIDEGKATPVKIYGIVLNYKDDVFKKSISKMTYQEEIESLITNEKRNKFISNLANSLSGNTLIIVRHIQKHAKPLKELLEKTTNKTVILIDKDTKSEIREDIRKNLENMDNTIIIATYKLIGTGVSIKRLHNIIYGCGVKKQNPVIQSIGRLLRLSIHKTEAKLFDIIDNLEYSGKENFSLSHARKRFEYYINEGHELIIKEMDF